MNHPATAGYFLRDEPNTESFAELGQWAKRIRATDDAHFCYLNLLPTYASLEALKADSYRDYVHRFDQEVPLQLLSFDHYPVVGRTLRPDYYENLEIFSDEARLAGKPFWAFAGDRARSVSDPGSGPDAVADVQQPGLWGPGAAVFYLLDSGKEPELNFHHGPIGLDGKRTDVYDKVTELNREIKALTGVFLGAKVLSVRHTGDTIPRRELLRWRSCPRRSKLQTTGTGAVVSELQNGDNRFLVIVNRDFNDRMQWISNSIRRRSDLKDGSIVPASLYSSTLMVEPGDAVIYAAIGMKRVRINTLLLCCAATLLGAGILGAQPKLPQKEIPILAWYGIPADEAKVERFQELKDAGFTLNFRGYSNADEVVKQRSMRPKK